MIYYDISSFQDIIDEHFNELQTYLNNRIAESTLNVPIKQFIIDNLQDIIKSNPTELKRLNDELKNHKRFSVNLNNKIKKIFNYKYFSTKSDNGSYDAYELAKKLNIRTCLYCNRNYTLTVIKGIRTTDKITRPEFDHYFDKGENPLLSLSIYNIIPSCKTCNSSLKGRIKFKLNQNVHPYIDNVINEYEYKFVPYDVQSIIGGSSNLSLVLKPLTSNNRLKKMINNSKEIFKLEEIMSAHSEELKDLFDIRYRFSQRYFEELFNKYSALGLDYNEIFRIVFGTYYTEVDFSRRPFSKLKKDILRELNIV